ncbi:MAG TPA: hypothetical protein VF698_05060 [Thermoanaerobaculia bacterium]|jgi:hypothetical protein
MIQKTGAGSYTLTSSDSLILKIHAEGTGLLADGAIFTFPVAFSVKELEKTVTPADVANAPENFLGSIRVIFTEESTPQAFYTLQICDSEGKTIDEMTSALPSGATLPRKSRFGLTFQKKAS